MKQIENRQYNQNSGGGRDKRFLSCDICTHRENAALYKLTLLTMYLHVNYIATTSANINTKSSKSLKMKKILINWHWIISYLNLSLKAGISFFATFQYHDDIFLSKLQLITAK